MRMAIGLLPIAGCFGLVAAAQAASPFDGTYPFAASAKVSETYRSTKGDMGYCPDRTPGAFTVVDGLARYTTESGDNLAAQVTPNGQFEMRFVEADGSGALRVLGEIDANGRVYARQMGNKCAHDFVWQKQAASQPAARPSPLRRLSLLRRLILLHRWSDSSRPRPSRFRVR